MGPGCAGRPGSGRARLSLGPGRNRVSFRLSWLLGPACWLLGTAAPLIAQDTPTQAERPRVERLVFEGVRNVSRGELRQSIATEATRCRSLVFRPLCAVTDAGFLWDRQYLDREELARDELRLRVYYFRQGWRQAQVRSEVTPEGDGVRVTFHVDEGEPTRTRAVAVHQPPDSVLGARQLRRAELPAIGEPLNLNVLDSARVRLLGQLWQRGYADARVADSIRLGDGPLAAALDVYLQPGRRTTIDTIVIEGNEAISERTIRRSFGLRPGQLYRRSDVLAGQRRLFQTDLFRQALVRTPETADSAKTVVISVREAPPRAVRAGVGFNTVEFAQAEARYTRFNWLGGARRLTLQASVGNLLAPQLYGRGPFYGEGERDDVPAATLQPTWQLAADVTQPWFLSTRNSLGLGVFAHRRSVPNIVVDRGYGARASFTRQLAERTPASLTYRFEQTRVEAGDVYFCVNFGVCRPLTIGALRQTQRLSPLGLTAFADRANDPVFPTGGFTARLDAEYASQFTASDFRYSRATGEFVLYRRFGPGVLAGRVRGGRVWPIAGTAEALGAGDAQETILHPRTRFYAGGSRSVRGYAENQLGPRILTIAPSRLVDTTLAQPCTPASIASAACDPNVAKSSQFQPRPLGGNSLVEGSLEYRLPLWGPLGGAVFVDAANVGDRNLNIPTGARNAVTPGFGVRYHSPIGAVRVDLGFRTGSLADSLPVVTETLGPAGERRVVQLREPMRYDPLEDAGGVRKLLSRMQLHLSIGQAF